MQKVKPLIRPDPRCTEMLRAIGGASAASGKSYKEICEKAGLQYSTFMQHKKDVAKMRFGEYWAFMDACEKIGG